jgi:hypothetical protein
MQDFLSLLNDAIKNGYFDAKKMAEEAPESIKKYALENNIDLASSLETDIRKNGENE